MDKKEIDETLGTLNLIAMFKSWLPFDLRGWVNALDLHVQARRAGGWTRLQAGGSLRSYVDAWREGDGDWQVKKFDTETWARRFAHVVDPTCEIAHFLNERVQYFGSLDAEGATALNGALQHYEATGIWSGLPRVPEDAVDRQLKERARAEAEEEHRNRIRLISTYKKQARKDPLNRSAWLSLSELYLKEHRYKDMENALKMQLRAEESERGVQGWPTCLQLGKVYLAALSTSVRGRGISLCIWGYMPPSSVKPEDLNYTVDQVRTLAIDSLSKASELMKQAGSKDGDSLVEEAKLGVKAASTLSVEAFEEFDISKAQQAEQETSQ